MKSLKCPVCSSNDKSLHFKTKDYDTGSKSSFTLVECKKCGLIFLDPQPGKKFLKQFYVFNYYGNQSFFHSIFLLINNFIIGGRAKPFLKRKKGTVLDVGCGDGDFLRYMKDKGWDVYGIEPSESGSRITRAKIKDHVYNDNLANVKFKGKFFDVITIEHVLEHVDYPNKMVVEAKRILKDEGLIVISVPNIGSLQAMIGKDKWFHLDIPRHLYHFSAKTLAKLLESNGFKVTKINHFSIVYNLIGVMQTCMNMIGIRFNFLHHLIKRVDRQKNFLDLRYIVNFILTMVCSAILIIPSLIFSLFESAIGRGSTITVYAKKK